VIPGRLVGAFTRQEIGTPSTPSASAAQAPDLGQHLGRSGRRPVGRATSPGRVSAALARCGPPRNAPSFRTGRPASAASPRSVG